MKKFFVVLFVLLSCFAALSHAPRVIADSQDQAAEEEWIIDENVTTVAKNTARFGMLLDWSLKNYSWICVTQAADNRCDNSNNPIAKLWMNVILFIAVPLLLLTILISALVIIYTRGTSMTVMRFIPHFILTVLFVFFSFALIQFVLQFMDVIQGIFFRVASRPCPPDCISHQNLFITGWDYRSFVGFRLAGPENGESTLMSLVLLTATGITYLFISVVLMIRKIMMWFFLIISPVLPFFFLYTPFRSTGRTWLNFFVKWLFYAPIFSVFLRSTIYMWDNRIPQAFGNPAAGDPDAIIFPTSINILLTGPGQVPSVTNSLNLPETFAAYVFALVMLWMAIIMPWLLMKYTINLNDDNSVVMKALISFSQNVRTNYLQTYAPSFKPKFTVENTSFVKRSITTTPNAQPNTRSFGTDRISKEG